MVVTKLYRICCTDKNTKNMRVTLSDSPAINRERDTLKWLK